MLAVEVHELEAQFVKLLVVQFPACRAPVLQWGQCLSPAPLAPQGGHPAGLSWPCRDTAAQGLCSVSPRFQGKCFVPFGKCGMNAVCPES